MSQLTLTPHAPSFQCVFRVFCTFDPIPVCVCVCAVCAFPIHKANMKHIPTYFHNPAYFTPSPAPPTNRPPPDLRMRENPYSLYVDRETLSLYFSLCPALRFSYITEYFALVLDRIISLRLHLATKMQHIMHWALCSMCGNLPFYHMFVCCGTVLLAYAFMVDKRVGVTNTTKILSKTGCESHSIYTMCCDGDFVFELRVYIFDYKCIGIFMSVFLHRNKHTKNYTSTHIYTIQSWLVLFLIR